LVQNQLFCAIYLLKLMRKRCKPFGFEQYFMPEANSSFEHCGNELNPLQSPPYFMANRVRAYSKIDVYAAAAVVVCLHKCAAPASLFTTFLGLAAIPLIATSIAQIHQSQAQPNKPPGGRCRSMGVARCIKNTHHTHKLNRRKRLTQNKKQRFGFRVAHG
jgi:hypothetical protein